MPPQQYTGVRTLFQHSQWPRQHAADMPYLRSTDTDLQIRLLHIAAVVSDVCAHVVLRFSIIESADALTNAVQAGYALEGKGQG